MHEYSEHMNVHVHSAKTALQESSTIPFENPERTDFVLSLPVSYPQTV